MCLSFLFWFGFTSCQSHPVGKKTAAFAHDAFAKVQEKLEDRLGPPWYRLAEANERLLSVGTTVLKFEIPAAGGRVRNLRVVSNTGGWMNELIARRSILEFRAPPAPPAVREELKGESFSMEESFTVFEKRRTDSRLQKNVRPKPGGDCAKRRECQFSGCRTESCALPFCSAFA